MARNTWTIRSYPIALEPGKIYFPRDALSTTLYLEEETGLNDIDVAYIFALIMSYQDMTTISSLGFL